MQIHSIAVWHWRNPEPRVVSFRLGALNVITGASKTGKSALLDIVDYCFGRSEESVAGERIRASVAWYGVTLALDSSYVFIGRPRTARGASTNEQVLLLESASPLLPEQVDLVPNTSTEQLRRRLSVLLGIGEHQTLVDESALGAPTAASVGQAIVLCLQKQGEVSSQDLLFHRQGEQRILESLRDTLPYFLGAEPWDQALLQVERRTQRRIVQGITNRLQAVETRAAAFEVELRALVEEAFAVGLIRSRQFGSRQDAIEALRMAAVRDLRSAPEDGDLGRVTTQRLELQEQQTGLRRELRRLIEDRGALRQLRAEVDEYGRVLQRQVESLTSLGLLSVDQAGADSTACPLCSQDLTDSDPSVEEMSRFARSLDRELTGLVQQVPRSGDALAEVDGRIGQVREELRGLDVAIGGLSQGSEEMLTRGEELAYYRGRLSASLTHLSGADETRSDRLRRELENASLLLRRTEEQLDGRESDLDVRLVEVSQYLTEYAQMLDVDHSEKPIILDIKNLTTIVTADSGRLRLSQVGSAANYLGLHLATHLGMHRFFMQENRPVPRFLMLDQPSQPFYPEDPSAETNGPSDAELPPVDSDRERSRECIAFSMSLQN